MTDALRVCGIDPGTDTLGICYLDIDLDTCAIKLYDVKQSRRIFGAVIMTILGKTSGTVTSMCRFCKTTFTARW